MNSSKALYILAIALAAIILLWSIIFFFIWVADFGMRSIRLSI